VFAAAAAASAAALAAVPMAAPIVNVAGAWTLQMDPNFNGEPQSVECAWEQDAEKITGDCAGVPIDGETADLKVTFRIKTGTNKEITSTFVGELDQLGTTIRGTWHLPEGNGERMGGFLMLRHE